MTYYCMFTGRPIKEWDHVGLVRLQSSARMRCKHSPIWGRLVYGSRPHLREIVWDQSLSSHANPDIQSIFGECGKYLVPNRDSEELALFKADAWATLGWHVSNLDEVLFRVREQHESTLYRQARQDLEPERLAFFEEVFRRAPEDLFVWWREREPESHRKECQKLAEWFCVQDAMQKLGLTWRASASREGVTHTEARYAWDSWQRSLRAYLEQ